MTMERMMTEAIRTFKRMKIGEIRSIEVIGWQGAYQKNINAEFHNAEFRIEYCKENSNVYNEAFIKVNL